MEMKMKKYDEVLHQAVLQGAYAYFSGGSQWSGAHSFVDAVKFIYEVDRSVFYDDFEFLWNGLIHTAGQEKMLADDVIEYIKNHAVYGGYWGPKLR
jgi:hypothetical protein